MTTLGKIRRKIIARQYYLSSHAEEEMLDDNLERRDVEKAIFKGKIDRKLTEDPRGVRYRIMGPTEDGRKIAVVLRFDEADELIIITVYRAGEI